MAGVCGERNGCSNSKPEQSRQHFIEHVGDTTIAQQVEGRQAIKEMFEREFFRASIFFMSLKAKFFFHAGIDTYSHFLSFIISRFRCKLYNTGIAGMYLPGRR